MSGCGGLRWIPPLNLSGCWQMAIDEWLLDDAVTRLHSPARAGSQPPAALLRFYSWSRPTLSLGYHQRGLDSRWLQLQQRGVLQLVRRPSGGRAVLHGGDLSYALIWPQAPASRREAYRRACRWLVEGFAAEGVALRFGAEQVDPLHPSCFSTSTAADLVEQAGGKRVGSAQLWRRGVLLQHGSILLAPDRDLWRRVLAEEPPPLSPLPCAPARLIEQLRRAAEQLLPIAPGGCNEIQLSPASWSAIAARRQRYRVGCEPSATAISDAGNPSG